MSLQIEALNCELNGQTILHDISLPALQSGTVVALAGPNGSGKSTLMRALAGIIPARSKRLCLNGTDLTRLGELDRADQLRYLPQDLPPLLDLTVLDALHVALNARKRAARTAADPEALAILTELELSHLAERSLRTLSGGQRQLTGLAQALCRPPRVLLLDEPVSALDLHFQHHILRTLRTLSKRHSLLIIVVLHDLNHVLRYTDHVVVLHQGGIAATGIPGKVLTPELLNAVFAVQARLETCSQGILHLMIDQPSPGLSPTRDQTL